MKSAFRVGLVGGSPTVFGVCREAIASIGEGVLVVEPLSSEVPSGLDMVLLVLEPPHVESVRRFGTMRETAPDLPVLLLANGLDVNHAVELVKFGAVDLLELPASKRTLARKIERVLRGTKLLTIESPVLSPLIPAPRPLDRGNLRASFRALVPERLEVSVVLLGSTAATRGKVLNLSVRSDDSPGGMCLNLPAPPPPELSAGVPASGIDVQLMIEAFGRIVMASGRVLRCEVHGGPPAVVQLGLTFTVKNRDDEALIQRVWVESQRQEATAPGARAPTNTTAKPVAHYTVKRR